MSKTSITQLAYQIALGELGVKEIPGAEHNKRILEYHATTKSKLTSDEAPWCSAFVNWCVEKAGFVGTDNAMARSWLLWGNKTTQPIVGDLVILKRGNDGISGHVGFVAKPVGKLDPYVYVLGGNQSNAVNVAKYLRVNVLGYRRN